MAHLHLKPLCYLFVSLSRQALRLHIQPPVRLQAKKKIFQRPLFLLVLAVEPQQLVFGS
ncbi:MAG: hypothetical protein KIS77_05735 [Saprospiraceae bacterium]|nr:hypothetical protein [Saprospiraceae bacterium]